MLDISDSGFTTSINKKLQGGEDGVTSRESQLVSADVTTEEVKEKEEDVLQDEEKKIQQEEPSDKKIIKLFFLL